MDSILWIILHIYENAFADAYLPIFYQATMAGLTNKFNFSQNTWGI